MKKIFVILFAVLLLACSSVCAQDTELQDLTFSTVGNIFSWGDKAEDVYAFLSQYGAEVEVDAEAACISISHETEEERFAYDFYFDNETEELYLIQCITALAEGIDPAGIVKDLITTYNLSEAEPYEDKDFEEYISGFDAGLIVAGSRTIAALAASEETDESYALIALMFADRQYWEAE